MEFIVEGHLPRKSNSRRIRFNPATGRPVSIKSAEALQYEQMFYYQIARQKPKQPLTGDLRLTAAIFYRSNRSDLSDELLADLCEKAGLIENDRQFKVKHLYHRVDAKRPRVEFKIDQLEAYPDTPPTTPPASTA